MNDPPNIDHAIATTFESLKVPERKTYSNHTFTIILMVVFFLVMMTCLTAGISIYRSVTNMQNQANALHMRSGLLVNVVRMNDSADAVAKGTGPEGDALVFVERLESGTYETRIYRYQGAIVQEYAIAGRPYNPENAVKVIDSDSFEFLYANGLVVVASDEGACDVALRSHQGNTSPIMSSGIMDMTDEREIAAMLGVGGDYR